MWIHKCACLVLSSESCMYKSIKESFHTRPFGDKRILMVCAKCLRPCNPQHEKEKKKTLCQRHSSHHKESVTRQWNSCSNETRSKTWRWRKKESDQYDNDISTTALHLDQWHISWIVEKKILQWWRKGDYEAALKPVVISFSVTDKKWRICLGHSHRDESWYLKL